MFTTVLRATGIRDSPLYCGPGIVKTSDLYSRVSTPYLNNSGWKRYTVLIRVSALEPFAVSPRGAAYNLGPPDPIRETRVRFLMPPLDCVSSF